MGLGWRGSHNSFVPRSLSQLVSPVPPRVLGGGSGEIQPWGVTWSLGTSPQTCVGATSQCARDLGRSQHPLTQLVLLRA